MRKIRIALIAGGWSGERDVSLRSGKTVSEALDRSKYEVVSYDPRDDLSVIVAVREQIDVAFVLMHGKYGEDGCIQGLLEMLGIRFVGSGVLSSAIALNKKIAKDIFRRHGLNVPRDIVLKAGGTFSSSEIMGTLGPMTVVKPVGEGSSLGMSLCSGEDELVKGIDKAMKHDEEIIVEEYIRGREVTCCVLGKKDLETLPLIEIIPGTGHSFFDYNAKYMPGATLEICPAEINPSIADRVREYAIKAHEGLRCRTWSRSDMIIRDQEIYLLETNTIPGMTENSLFPLAARSAGLSMSALVDKLVSFSLENPLR